MLPNLLIIGAGSAGITCAINAASKGKKVCIIDKANQPGGTLHLTAGHLSAANTQLQCSKGIQDSTDEHYADIVKISRNTMNPLIARKAVDLAPSTINWLQDIGYPFHEKAPLIIYGHEPYSKPRTYLGTSDISPLINAPGKTVLKVLLPLWNKYISAGLIDFRANTQLISIEKKGNTITSILVDGAEGLVRLSAHNYILTTLSGVE